MSYDVGVVIVSYNSAHVIEGLLATIPQALDGLSAVTAVVDNGSTDNSLEILRARDDCLVVENSNTGYAAGVNRGVEALPGVETILVLNPDVRLGPGSVRSMFATLQATRAAVVAPRVLQPDGQLFRSLRREPVLLRTAGLGWTKRPCFDEYISDPATYEHRQVVDWALGAALLVRRDVHTALGGWDESYFLYSEETDFSLRAKDRGWSTVYEPTAVVTHIGGASGRTVRTHVMQVLNRVRLYARRHPPYAGVAYLCLSVLSETSWVLRGQGESIASVKALLSPRSRPAELGCSDTIVPR
ncbi:glycosyltransferase family 2 protein [Aeromicrobium wangtongii]|uniref:Glycosyltransferase family 2 protein n=1 Tax=Aeromicrobium wangtongii TaxID=2969247 RepID=A0ABY5MB90_9ACTN|nr:glycosyltransferase family 2 protein [Aeromicrobium wangtongii]MCD9196887.1 glycosyltransferase family 2 protein [Aeromicrobium wangtongii]UUP14394.1 glycosyltransferase family 2 protein [Aeromicrobium wangtongii]